MEKNNTRWEFDLQHLMVFALLHITSVSSIHVIPVVTYIWAWDYLLRRLQQINKNRNFDRVYNVYNLIPVCVRKY
jgi:hypothetical protein